MLCFLRNIPSEPKMKPSSLQLANDRLYPCHNHSAKHWCEQLFPALLYTAIHESHLAET